MARFLKIVTKIISEFIISTGVEVHIFIGIFILAIILISFDILCIVGVWRSSERYNGPIIWRALAKLCIILNLFGYIALFR